MTPMFLHITTTGKIYATCDYAFAPAGLTILATFQLNPNCQSQLVCTLTGSGNSSASALGATVATKSGKGNEIV